MKIGRGGKKLGKILDAASVGVWEWDIESKRISVNRGWLQMLGYKAAEEVFTSPSSWLDIVHPDDREWAAGFIQQVIGQGEMDEGFPHHELRLLHRNGTWIWVKLQGISVERDRSGKFISVAGVQTDITERKKNEALLEETQAVVVAQERQAAVGQLSGGFAHNFNNILTTIIGTTELLALDPGLTGRQRQMLDLMISSEKRAAKLVRQITDFGRKSLIRSAVMDLSRQVEQKKGALQELAGAGGNIEFKLEDTADHLIKADKNQIPELLVNLLLNAADAVRDGGTVRVSCGPEHLKTPVKCDIGGCLFHGECVRLTVEDSGKGIAPEDLGHIFEPFFSTKPASEGAGLGLSQVSGIVDQNRGHITVESVLGKGTRINVYFPVLDAAESRKLTVLVAEDDNDILNIIARALGGLDMDVLLCRDGREALERYSERSGAFDLVVSDIKMPNMDGITLCQKIAGIREGQRILLMTGYSEYKDRIKELPVRNLKLLIKPFAIQELKQTVREMMYVSDGQMAD